MGEQRKLAKLERARERLERELRDTKQRAMRSAEGFSNDTLILRQRLRSLSQARAFQERDRRARDRNLTRRRWEAVERGWSLPADGTFGPPPPLPKKRQTESAGGRSKQQQKRKKKTGRRTARV